MLGINADPVDHRAHRVRDRRAGLGRGLGGRRSVRPRRRASRWRWWGRARPAWPPPSSWPRRPRGGRLRAGRAPGGLLRYGIPEFKMEKAVLDRRLGPDARPRAWSSAAASRSGRPSPRRAPGRWPRGRTVACRRADLVAELRRRGAGRRGHPAPRPAGRGPRPRRDPPGHGLPEAVQHGPGGRARRSRRSPPQGKHVVIIGGGDTGADCLGTAHRQGAPSRAPARDPARAARRTGPRTTRGRPGRSSSGPPRPTRRAASASSRSPPTSSSTTAPARWPALAGHEVELTTGADGRPSFDAVRGQRVRAAVRAGAAGHGLPRRRAATAWWPSSASSSTPGAAWPPTTDWPTNVRGRLRVRRHDPGPEPHRVGHRRGPLGRRRASTATSWARPPCRRRSCPVSWPCGSGPAPRRSPGRRVAVGHDGGMERTGAPDPTT